MTQVNSINVKCPMCGAMLSVSADRRGDRFTCEKCGGTIKVPGQIASGNDDDQWLTLETDAAPAPKATGSPRSDLGMPAGMPTRMPGDAFGGFDDDDEFRLPDLGDVPTSPLGQSPSTRPAPPPSLSDADLQALSGFADEPEQRPAPMKLVEPKTPAGDSFRLNCPICDSLIYAKFSQVGKRIRCSDCHSPLTVPPPPKVKPKYEHDLEAASTYQFQDGGEDQLTRPADPFRKSADAYLRAAEDAETETEDKEWELPSFQEWFSGLASVFRDPAVILHILILSTLAFVPTAFAVQYESSVVVMGLFAGGAVFGMIVVACGFAILQAVANGEERVSEWPVFDPMEWVGQLLVAIAAVGVAAGPVWMITHYLFQGGLITVATTMLSLYVLYPIVLMSMMDEQSILVPFSADVTKSVVRAPDQWGAAYLASGILFAAMFFLFMIASVSPPIGGALITILCSVTGVFVYFAILGRLAFGISHSLNAPPMVNDIDRSVKPDEVK
jgi:DNA-directed RNA polymerase subunit M/transcription elongation factor TFIIS